MQFIVITAEGTETYDGSYEVEDTGVLKIRPKDRSELISLSPAFWRQINEPRSSYDMLDSAYGAERQAAPRVSRGSTDSRAPSHALSLIGLYRPGGLPCRLGPLDMAGSGRSTKAGSEWTGRWLQQRRAASDCCAGIAWTTL